MRGTVKKKPVWQVWFAWYPITFDGQRVWLERVERRVHHWIEGWYWIYREARK
jgi:hypothetical protein